MINRPCLHQFIELLQCDLDKRLSLFWYPLRLFVFGGRSKIFVIPPLLRFGTTDEFAILDLAASFHHTPPTFGSAPISRNTSITVAHMLIATGRLS